MNRRPQRNRMRPTARIRKHFTDLEYLARAKKAVRSRMLSRASTDLILAIVDVAKALINGEMQLTSKQLSAAKRRKTDILKLASKGGIRQKRILLEQKGNLIGALLGPLVKGLAPVLKGVVQPLIGSFLGGFGGGSR